MFGRYHEINLELIPEKVNIPVTRSFLPPYSEFQELLEGVWNSRWLTNNGPLLNELELRLKDFLQLQHLLVVNNGTIALQLAIRALDLKGDVITTPFSYVATTSSISWEGCRPVFVDIDPDTFNIDPKKIEQAITEKTIAIMATHVYGNPCDVEAIEKIARKHHLKVIYDGAHAFATIYKERSVFEYGDITTTSFHATKLFHMVEGGGLFTKDPELLKKLAWMRNFGHKGLEAFHGCGINGKSSEFHAAMGLCNLRYINVILKKRKELTLYYRKMLTPLRVRYQKILPGTVYNYAYFPILMESEEAVLKSIKVLHENSVVPRRYFYPSLNDLPYVDKSPCPVSEDTARRILCLPLYPDLREQEIDFIGRLLLRVQNNPA